MTSFPGVPISRSRPSVPTIVAFLPKHLGTDALASLAIEARIAPPMNTANRKRGLFTDAAVVASRRFVKRFRRPMLPGYMHKRSCITALLSRTRLGLAASRWEPTS